MRTWAFDFADAHGVGGFVALLVHPDEGVASWWAALVQPGVPGPVVVFDDEVAPPRGHALEVRADGLWAELVCETPDDHWGIALEAFGLRLDDPADAVGTRIGERVPVGLDLEWEATGDVVASGDGVCQAGTVRGELLIGRDVVAFDGNGVRRQGNGAPFWEWETATPHSGDSELAVVWVPLPRGALRRSLTPAGWRDRVPG